MIYLKSNQIQTINQTLAEQINFDYKNQNEPVICYGVLNGCFMFFSDIVRLLKFELDIRFVEINTYHNDKKTSTTLPNIELFGNITQEQTILVFDEICDTGGLFLDIQTTLSNKNNNVKFVSLLTRYSTEFNPHYTGKIVEHDNWLYGYGMDLDETKRNLPDIYLKT